MSSEPAGARRPQPDRLPDSESPRDSGGLPDFEPRCKPAIARQAASIAFRMIDEENLDSERRHDLYAGRLGLSVVHAVGSGLGLEGASGEAALAYLEERSSQESGELPPVGGLIGAGAVLYAHMVCAECLDEPDLLERAGTIAGRLDEQHFESDRHLDVLQGTAGMVLALLALERVARRRGDDEMAELAIDKAVTGARHLLRVRSREERRAWANAHGVVLTGFAHGASGAACALLRLASRLQERAREDDDASHFLAAAAAAVDFEEDFFDVERGRWRVHARDAGDAGPSHAWCYGSPGIVLSRLEAWRAGEWWAGEAMDQAQQRLERAVEAAVSAPLGDTDHLCCGNLGRAWILAEASRRLVAAGSGGDTLPARLAYEAAVRSDRLAFDALRYFKRRQRFGVDEVESGSLFKGPAGLCLAFLALSSPGEVPFLLDLSAPSAP